MLPVSVQYPLPYSIYYKSKAHSGLLRHSHPPYLVGQLVMLTDGYILALVAHSADESQYGATTWKASNLTQKNRKLTMPSIPKGETAPACQENRKTEQRMTLQQPNTRSSSEHTNPSQKQNWEHSGSTNRSRKSPTDSWEFKPYHPQQTRRKVMLLNFSLLYEFTSLRNNTYLFPSSHPTQNAVALNTLIQVG